MTSRAPARLYNGHLRSRGLRAVLQSPFVHQALLLLLIVSALTAVAWIYASPIFRVSRIQVTGVQRLDGATIAATSGLLGQSIFTMNQAAVADAIGKNPLVKTVSIASLPPNGVAIQIQERQPWGFWKLGQTHYLVDDDGVVIGPASLRPDLPLIVDKGSGELVPGQQVDGEAVRLAQWLQKNLPRAMPTKAIAFEYAKNGGLVAVIDGGRRARFGDGQDLERKVAIWKAILAQAAKAGLDPKHVDLRFGDRPFFR